MARLGLDEATATHALASSRGSSSSPSSPPPTPTSVPPSPAEGKVVIAYLIYLFFIDYPYLLERKAASSVVSVEPELEADIELTDKLETWFG